MNQPTSLSAEIALLAAMVDETINELNRLFDESIVRLEEICTRPLSFPLEIV